MKNLDSLTKEFHEFVVKHKHDDIPSLILRHKRDDLGFPIEFAAMQIACRRRTDGKLRWFNANDRFLYPCEQVSEQSSHQSVALYHALIAGRGKRIVDLTAGLGIDAFAMALRGNDVTCVELDEDRHEALRHNADALGLKQVKTVCGDCLQFLHDASTFDVAFIDPARRDASDARIYSLSDSLPDVVANRDLITSHCKQLVIKASPMADVTALQREMRADEIHVVCVKGECKETLLILDCDQCQMQKPVRFVVVDLPQIDCPDWQTDESEMPCISRFEFSEGDNNSANVQYCEPEEMSAGKYLYDPNAGMRKLNAAAELTKRFEGLKQASPGTMLFISNRLHADFPGRIFRINAIPAKKDMKHLKGEPRAVTVRNYPQEASLLRKKLGVKESDSEFIIAFRAGKEARPVMADCSRLFLE